MNRLFKITSMVILSTLFLASCGKGQKTDIPVTVTPVQTIDTPATVDTPDEVKVNFKFGITEITLDVGKSKNIDYSGLPKEAKIKWQSSDEAIAAVDNEGRVTAVGEGKCVITAAVNGVTEKAYITVKPQSTDKTEKPSSKIEDTSIHLSISSIVEVGSSIPFEITRSGASVELSDIETNVSDTSVLKIDENGTITALQTGICTVTASLRSDSSIKDSVVVNVINSGRTVQNNHSVQNVPNENESVIENNNNNGYEEPSNSSTTDNNSVVSSIVDNNAGETVSENNEDENDNGNENDIGSEIDEPSDPGTNSVVEYVDGLYYVDGILIANKTYPLPAGYNPGGLTAQCSEAFERLRAGAWADGINIYLSSGSRSYETQWQLYNGYTAIYGQQAADTFSARPGHSEHQTGLAIDCNIINSSFAGTPEAIWLENHCHEYGFIIRYPQGKEWVTGYIYEPWHIRYIGDKATEIYESGLTLEEYYGFTSEYR